MTDIVDELLDFTTRDHERGCTGREYVCSCGYDNDIEAAVKKAAAEIERLRSMIKAVEKERDAATAGARDTAKHLARFMATVGEIYVAANKDMDDDGHR